MKLLDRDTNKDGIISYLKDPDGDIETLSAKQQQLLKYYMDGYTLMRNYNSMPDAVNILVKMSKNSGDVISQSTARRYIIEGRDIFGDVNKVSKQAALDYGLSVIQDAINMARDQNDPKTMILGAKEYIEKSTKEDPESFDPEMLQQHIIEILGDAKTMQMLDVLVSKGSVDLDMLMGNVMNAMAEDAEVLDDPS
jgi:hypothetical protein